MIDLPEAKGRLESLEPEFIAAHQEALVGYVERMTIDPGWFLAFDMTTRANILNNQVCARIEQRAASWAGVEVNDRLRFFALLIEPDILLRFKYVGHGVPHNVPTEQQKLLARQTYDEPMMLALAGDADAAPPTMLTCGYTIDGDEIGRVEIRYDCKGHQPWSYDIYGGTALSAPQMLPGMEDTTKPAKITRKIAAEGEDAASANGAS
jgi:hypothetical protein